MTHLGNHVKTIHPKNSSYMVNLIIGIGAIATSAMGLWKNFVIIGIPLNPVMLIIGIALVVMCGVKMFQAKGNDNNIELYENGLSFTGFEALYKDLSVKERSGAASTILEFTSETEVKTYKHSVDKADIAEIQSRISAAR